MRHIPAIRAHVRAVAQAVGHSELAALADHGERVRRLVAELPEEAWHRIEKTVTTRYHSLEHRYGRPMAVAIISTAIVGTAVPLPGTSILAVAPLIGLAELHRRLTATPGPTLRADQTKAGLTEAEVHRCAEQWVRDLVNSLKNV